jgi:peptidoglycan/xylan/chitin deacetylase (PgdA/CDA1 family)
MSVDVDSWSSLLNFYSIEHDADEVEHQVSVEKGLDVLLDLFERNDVKATFFVPGEVAQRHPLKIKEINEKGHEIACHGFLHERNECLLDTDVQRSRIEKSVTIVEEITHRRPVGFRAPCLRANDATLAILCEMGFKYDSSFLPMLIPGQYGSLSFHLKPHLITVAERTILEIPVSTNPLVPLPLSASWMRNFGLLHVKFGIRMLFGRGYPVMFYVHPRDVVNLPRIQDIPWHLYTNVGSRSVEMLGEIFSFVKKSGGRILRAKDFALEFMKKEQVICK